jgi:hypothetical protein
MRFQGAVIKEQGVTFAVVIVKKSVIDNRPQANRAIQGFQLVFPGLPIVLMAQDHRGRPSYFGRKDISRFLAGVPLHAIPWREYTVSNS